MTAAKFNLSDLLPPKIDKSPSTIKGLNKNELRARLMAQEWLRNGQDIASAYSTVTGRKHPRNKTLSLLTNGNEDAFIDEIRILYGESGIDKVQILDFLWAVTQASLLDFFNEKGQLLDMVELRKMPRVYQRMITEMDVSTSETPLLGAHKQPMMDDDGKVIMKTVSRVKIKMPEKLAAIAQLASIMKWIGPSVLIDNRTINIAEMMTEGDSRLRKMEKSYEAGRIQEGQFKVTTGEKSHE